MIVKIYNANNTDAVALKNPDNLYRETESGGSIKLCFDISPKDEQYKLIAEEIKLEYDNIFYTIKKINERKTVSSIEAVIDLDDFKKQAYYDYYKTEYLLSDLLDDCLNGTGWIHKDSTLISKKHTVELKNCNTLDIINEASKLWGCQFSFDNKNKVITAIDTEIKQPTGVFFTDELNLLSVGFKGDSSSFITRLKCRGAKDENDNYLTFADINDGKDYVENYDYSDKVITGVWVDERYTDKQSLKDDAIERLKTLAIPVRSYECTIADLAKIDPKYNNFAVALYDIVTLIDRERKTRVNHRIVKLREYDKTPLKNVITLNSVTNTITGNIKQLDTLISNAGDIKVDGITLNEFKRDINNNSLEIQKRYTKGETDTILDTKILQSESEIMTKVSEKYSTKEDTTNEISSAVTQTKSDITFDFKNGGLSSNVVFNSEGQIIYNGGLTIFNKNNTKQFYADDEGTLTLSGNIIASGGNIAGWNINSNSLEKFQYSDDDKLYWISLMSPTKVGSWGMGTDVFVFRGFAGSSWSDNYTDYFRLNSDGTLFTMKLNATGGTIGSFILDEDYLQSKDRTIGIAVNKSNNGQFAFWAGGNSIETTKFRVDHAGNLFATNANITGTIIADDGTVGGWTIKNNWIGASGELDYYGNGVYYTYGAGLYAGAAGTKNTCLAIGYMPYTIDGSWDNAEFRVTGDGKLYATGANITGTINATSGSFGCWAIGKSSYGGQNAMIADDGYNYTAISPQGLYYVNKDGGGDMFRTWGQILVSASDKRLKNSIEYIVSHNNLEAFFNSLKPCTYYYKNGYALGDTSKLHIGFIAQDIQESVNNFDIQKFSGLSENFREDYFGLNYQEFIALNTWQIQKLKKKVTDLTEKLDKQQKEIDDLKALIQ